jgi:hypothetical protein
MSHRPLANSSSLKITAAYPPPSWWGSGAYRTQNAFLKEQPKYLALLCIGAGEFKPIATPFQEGGGVMCAFSSTEETRVEEKQKEFICPLSWSVQHNLARDGYIESTSCCVQARFRHWNKNTFSLVMVYSAQFNNVFKALNLFLYKYVAEIQLHSNGIWLLSIPHGIFAQTLSMTSSFNLPCSTVESSTGT